MEAEKYLTGSNDHSIKLWNLGEIKSVRSYVGPAFCMSISKWDENLFYATYWSGDIIKWNVDGAKIMRFSPIASI